MTYQPTRIWLFDNNQPKPEGLQPGDLALNTGPFPRVLISTAPSVPDGSLKRGVLARWDGRKFETRGVPQLSDDDTDTRSDINELTRAVGENTRRLNESLEKLNAIHLSVVGLGEEVKS